MSETNPLWGAPRIHGELLKLGVDISQASVAKYIIRRHHSPSAKWRTSLRNHIGQIVAADFFLVPTATCRFLFVLVLLAHDRRHVTHVAVTAHLTATWTVQQLREAFPWDQEPRFLLHDRDHAFGGVAAAALGMHDIRTAPRSPWQNAYVERFIGSVRRECLDHVIIVSAAGLRRVLNTYVAYYSASRTHLALQKDAPLPRPVFATSRGARRRDPPRRRSPPSIRTTRCVTSRSLQSDRISDKEYSYSSEDPRGSLNALMCAVFCVPSRSAKSML